MNYLRNATTTLLGAALVAWSAGDALGQGFYFQNRGANDGAWAPIYGPEPDNPYLQKWGNEAQALPPGTQTYTGPLLDGTNYSVQAFFSLTPVQHPFELMTDAPPRRGIVDQLPPAGVFSSAG